MKKTLLLSNFAANQRKRFCSFFLLVVLLVNSSLLFGQSPLAANGRLHVEGTNIVNESGTPIQLRGMSSQGIQWYTEDYNFNSLNIMVNKWGIDVFRVAITPSLKKDKDNKTTLGYDGNPEFWKGYIDKIVDLCGSFGIYCIIDWHILDGNGLPDPSDPDILPLAKEFWDYMSKTHAGKKQVIYEICNEPLVEWSGAGGIKSYAETIIPIIRANDPDAIIIVGTPFYSSQLNKVTADPLTGDITKNVMYALHFYAGEGAHRAYREILMTALSKGLPVFVSEWGTTPASGAGKPKYDQTEIWLDTMKNNKISWCNWNYSDKAETSSALVPCSGAYMNWDNTTEAGSYIKGLFTNPEDSWNSSGLWKPAVYTYVPVRGYQDFEAFTGYYKTNKRIILQANGASKNDEISSIEFFVDGTSIGNGVQLTFGPQIEYPYQIQWTPTVAKDYVITAIATDKAGMKSDVSLPITIHVVDVLPVSTPYPDPSSPAAIPGTINLVNFDNGGEMVAYHDFDAIHKGFADGNDRSDEGVDIERTTNIGYGISGEWLNYTVDVKESGLYKLTLTTASGLSNDGVIYLKSNGHQITKYIEVPPTAGWDKKAEVVVNDIPLSKGVQVLTLCIGVGNSNFYTAKFEYMGGKVHTITTSTDGGGTVIPALDDKMLDCGTFTVADGGYMSIIPWPDYGYILGSVTVDGKPTSIYPPPLHFEPVTESHTVHVTFRNSYVITATAGSNGSINPGTATYFTGDTVTYTFTPNPGYQVSEILVDGSPVPVASSYTFNNITAKHTIAVSFDVACTLLSLYNAPGTVAFPSLNTSYNNIYVLGTHEALPNIKKFTINWDLANKSIYDLSVEINNAPYYIDLKGKVTQTLSTTTPGITISGSNAGIDGDYYAVMDGSNLVLLEKTGTYALYFSATATTPKTCTSTPEEPKTGLFKLFDVPRESNLPGFTASYNHAYVIEAEESGLKSTSFKGAFGPNLNNVNNFVINWDLANKSVYQFSFQTNNGVPTWWLDLIPKTKFNFANVPVSCKISGSGIPGLDGDYYANYIGGNFVLVSTSGKYAIYGSNSSTPPAGASFKNTPENSNMESSNETISMFPNPLSRNSAITINFTSVSDEGAVISISDISGKVLYNTTVKDTQSSLYLGDMFTSGLYIVKIINGDKQYNEKLIIK